MRDLSTIADAVVTTVKDYVGRALAPLAARVAALEERPAPCDGVDGKDGAPGLAGRDASIDDVRAAVVEALRALPPPSNGKDGRDGVDGKDADPAAMEAAVGRAVAKAMTGLQETIGARVAAALADLPKPRDGRDGQPGSPGAPGEKGHDGANGKDGRDGVDGLGIDDLTIEYDGERTFAFKWQRGERVKSQSFVVPMMLYRGLFVEAHEYATGDVCTWGGSTWVALADTKSKPDAGDGTWKLMVKKGRDGKDGDKGDPGKPGRDGKDAQ